MSVRRVVWAWWNLKRSTEPCPVRLFSLPEYFGRGKPPQFDVDMCRICANAETDYCLGETKDECGLLDLLE